MIGVAAIYSDSASGFGGQPLTANIVTLSVFGALLMYAISMAALFRLRRARPRMERPWRAPLYPYLPGFALVCAVICLASVLRSNRGLGLVFAIVMAVGTVMLVQHSHRKNKRID